MRPRHRHNTIALTWLVLRDAWQAVRLAHVQAFRVYEKSEFWSDLRFYVGWVIGLFVAPPLIASSQDKRGRQTRDFFGRVADVEHGNIEFIMQAFEIRQNLELAFLIERGERFIEQEQTRTPEQGPRDSHTLPFAARQSSRHAIQQMADAKQFRRLCQFHTPLRGRDAIEPVAQILLHAQMRKQARFLKDVAERTLMRRQKDVAVAFGIEPDFAVDDELPLPGRTRPARQRSSVVLLEPKWPKIAVTPRPGKVRSRSSVKPRCSTRKRASIASFAFCEAPITLKDDTSADMRRNRSPARIKQQQNDERKRHHAARQPVCLCVFERFYAIENLHGDDARLAQNIAADHQHGTEFADGMRKAENHRRDDARPR